MGDKVAPAALDNPFNRKTQDYAQDYVNTIMHEPILNNWVEQSIMKAVRGQGL